MNLYLKMHSIYVIALTLIAVFQPMLRFLFVISNIKGFLYGYIANVGSLLAVSVVL